LTRRVDPAALDEATREALVALASAPPSPGAPAHRVYTGVLGDTRRLVDDVVAREADLVANEPYGSPRRHGWVLEGLPPSADPVVEFMHGRLGEVSTGFGLGLPLDDDGRPPLELSDVRITVHRDGDFLGSHHDDHWPGLRNGRLLSFVYWFHSQPRAFEGGSLVLSGWARHEGALQPFGPQLELPAIDDTLVVFPSSTRHELQRVRCQPDALASARFAIVAFAKRSTVEPLVEQREVSRADRAGRGRSSRRGAGS
jgi:hypothetical protein